MAFKKSPCLPEGSGDLVLLLWVYSISPVPVFLSILAGITVITSRLVNASLAQKTSILCSTWYNYLTGLVLSVALLLVYLKKQPSFLSVPAGNYLIYTGGVIGVLVVILFNLCTLKLPVFSMTLTIFIGQVFTSMLLDVFLEGTFSLQYFSGGILTAMGLCLNFILEKKNPRSV